MAENTNYNYDYFTREDVGLIDDFSRIFAWCLFLLPSPVLSKKYNKVSQILLKRCVQYYGIHECRFSVGGLDKQQIH
jgi:hypothetical protein